MNFSLKLMYTLSITGLAALTNSIVTGFIVLRLRKPASYDNYRIRSFRGSFFWFFLFTFLFSAVMAVTTLYYATPLNAGYGYVIGHFFFYIGLSIYVFAPAAVVMPEKKIPPTLLSAAIFVSMIYITIFNWFAYKNGDNVVDLENNLAIFNPPNLVFMYIAVVAGICFLILGTTIFFYHSFRTQSGFLKRRSRFIAIGFLIAGLAGPLNDQTWKANIAPFAIAFATLLTTAGFMIIARGVLLTQESQEKST